jgi:hypothetical protein
VASWLGHAVLVIELHRGPYAALTRSRPADDPELLAVKRKSSWPQ